MSDYEDEEMTDEETEYALRLGANAERSKRDKFTALLNDTAEKLRSNEKNISVTVKESEDLTKDKGFLLVFDRIGAEEYEFSMFMYDSTTDSFKRRSGFTGNLEKVEAKMGWLIETLTLENMLK